MNKYKLNKIHEIQHDTSLDNPNQKCNIIKGKILLIKVIA